MRAFTPLPSAPWLTPSGVLRSQTKDGLNSIGYLALIGGNVRLRGVGQPDGPGGNQEGPEYAGAGEPGYETRAGAASTLSDLREKGRQRP